ncbi:MAG: sodium:solute symporter [Mediterranea sp.]|jgi:SSS family solute:Na+ symporter|nr:sodium:solute symporter [Mediterranea sp.]
MSLLDIIIFLAFTGGVVFFGCSFFSKKRTSDELTAAGRSLPGWVVGMSIFATYVSSISYLANPGKSYMGDWNAFVFSLSIPIASYFAAKYFVPFYRSLGSVSAYSFLEERFGPWARVYASTCYLLTQLARTGGILYLLALPMNQLLGWDIRFIIVCTSILIAIYALAGGIKAVIWTEAIQGFILIAGAVVCVLVLIFSMPEGPGQFVDLATHARDAAGQLVNKFSLGSFGASLTDSTFWVCLVYGIFINLQNYGIDQNYVQRYHTAKDMKSAKFSALFGGYLYIPVSAVFFLIGTALYTYYQAYPGLLPADVTGDSVFPYFIVHQLPHGLIGLLIASIFAAGMSTVATSITSSSTILLTDYYQRFFRRHATERESVRMIYVFDLVVMVLGVLVAFAFMHVSSALDAWWKLSSIFSGGILGLFLLGYVSRKVENVNAVLGTICGAIVIVWMSLSSFAFFKEGCWGEFASPLHANLTIVVGTLVIFLVGFLSMGVVKGKKGNSSAGKA